MIVLYILAIVGFIVIMTILIVVLGLTQSKKPNIPLDLFEDSRGDLRQLQDWYFARGRREEMEKVSHMLRVLDDIWAEYDMTAEKDETPTVTTSTQDFSVLRGWWQQIKGQIKGKKN